MTASVYGRFDWLLTFALVHNGHTVEAHRAPQPAPCSDRFGLIFTCGAIAG